MQTKKDLKILLSLMLWSLAPSVYLLIRMGIVSISSVDINILGQMEWFDLIDEIIVTTLTVPLYFILKPDKSDKYKNGSALLISFGTYFTFALIMSMFVGNIAEYMNAAYATRYLFLQNISMLSLFVSTFMIMVFLLNQKYGAIIIAVISRLVLLSLFDYIFILKYKDIGASYSEILVNSLVSLVCITYGLGIELVSFKKFQLDFINEWIKKGIPAGISIFLDNYIYAIMICKMVNAVSESGNYWVANNFIWGWLLVPVSCMAQIIEKNKLKKLTFKNTWCYMLIIFGVWTVTFPFWSGFINNAMFSDSKVVLNIVYPLIPFYLIYTATTFIDAWFISKGRTLYMAINSVIVNIVYYGIVYILFRNGVFKENLTFIIYMFGFGMVVHAIVSGILYIIETGKNEFEANTPSDLNANSKQKAEEYI